MKCLVCEEKMYPDIFKIRERIYYGANKCPKCDRKELEGLHILEDDLKNVVKV